MATQTHISSSAPWERGQRSKNKESQEKRNIEEEGSDIERKTGLWTIQNQTTRTEFWPSLSNRFKRFHTQLCFFFLNLFFKNCLDNDKHKENHTSGKVVVLSLRKMNFLWNYTHSHLLVKRLINNTALLQGSPSVRSPNTSSLAGFSPTSCEVGKQLCFTNSVWVTTSSMQAWWSWDSNPGVCDSRHGITDSFIRTHVDGWKA